MMMSIQSFAFSSSSKFSSSVEREHTDNSIDRLAFWNSEVYISISAILSEFILRCLGTHRMIPFVPFQPRLKISQCASAEIETGNRKIMILVTIKPLYGQLVKSLIFQETSKGV